MLYDNDLTSLRKDKTYQALLTAVKEKTPLHVLRKSASYAKDSVRLDVKFTYMPKDDYRLSVVRDYLKLDSVAGQGDELSKIINDGECHVINAVWSSQLQKWLWIDPTNDAWVMDENGTMLSIAEVRERMINDQPLVLCETANWNHSEKQTKEGYLYGYMSKNLYYFVCKKYSRFNPESDYRPNPAEEDIRLIPVGFVNDNWKCDTTDPDFFWAKPE